MRIKLSDVKELSDKFRVERDSQRKELDKMQDLLREFKDEASSRYETYSKQINQSESQSEDKLRAFQRDNERLREENVTMRKNQ